MPAELSFNPIAGAVEKLAARRPVGSALRTEDWAQMPLALRERAQFSAGVESVRVMAAIQDKLEKAAAMLREQAAHGEAGVNAGSFIADIKRVLREEGIAPGAGGLTDITSARRLKLIYDFQREAAAEYARWKASQDPVALDNFPAQEFLRVESRQAPRDWAPRWDMAFAPFEGATRAASGRMVALKNHPGWRALSRFGTPWPPFDFGSGMGVEDVAREEAVALGVIRPDETLVPAEADFNADLEASVTDLPTAWQGALQSLFGDQVVISGGRARWAAKS